MKPPAYLLPKSRKAAIHFIRLAKTTTALFGETGMNAIACGAALDAAGWTSRATTEAHRVTCRECWKLAHPTTPIDWSTKP